MSENFNSMYWIGKRVEHEELSEALRAAARRKRRKARSEATDPIRQWAEAYIDKTIATMNGVVSEGDRERAVRAVEQWTRLLAGAVKSREF